MTTQEEFARWKACMVFLDREVVAEARASLDDIVAKLVAEAVAAEREAIASLASEWARCGHCYRPATCVGAYEGSPTCGGCDECCGHGNEDGYCLPVGEYIDAAIRARGLK